MNRTIFCMKCRNIICFLQITYFKTFHRRILTQNSILNTSIILVTIIGIKMLLLCELA